jgi:hypothetical protein
MAETNYSIDSDGAKRRPLEAIEKQHIEKPESIIILDDPGQLQSLKNKPDIKAAIITIDADERKRLSEAFEPCATGRYKLNEFIIAKIGRNDQVEWDFRKNQNRAFPNPEMAEELEKMALLFNKATGHRKLFLRLSTTIDTFLHRHNHPTLNRVFGDSATGWYTTDGPQNAGEGNLLYFKKGFSHETTRRENPEDNTRMAVIFFPFQPFWIGV